MRHNQGVPRRNGILIFCVATYRQKWLGNIKPDLLFGLVVALVLIPEAMAFLISASVDPKVGLFASFSITLITATSGGWPGMISAATAASAVLMIKLIKDHELQYLLAATVLAGLLQSGTGLVRFGFVLRHVSKTVMTGFFNAWAIQIILVQLPKLDSTRVTWLIYVLMALTLTFGRDVSTLGDKGGVARHAAGSPDLRYSCNL